MPVDNASWTFERLRERLDLVEAPSVAGNRETLWVVDRLLGVARSHLGGVEVFLVGARLHPRTATVRRHLEHGEWGTSSGDVIEASRLVFPNEQHFVALGALICVEMLRAGASASRPLQSVFEEVEPLIELALRRGALTEESVLGLVGELLALEQMLLAVADRAELAPSVLDMWRGHHRGERDLTIGAMAIEVKTTRHDSSSHRLAGFSQVEPAEGEDGLFLLSLGLAPTAAGDGQTLPDVVDRLLAALGPWTRGGPLSPVQERLLRDVAAYGQGDSAGYDHLTMAEWTAYQTTFRTTFTPRLYDLTDPDVRLLRRADVADKFVDPGTVEYQADLPAAVNGRNPAANWTLALGRIVRERLRASPT